MNKSILIFGAGLNQYQLIKAERDLGVTSVVLDPNPDATGINTLFIPNKN